MKNILLTIGSIAIVTAGISATILADQYGLLPGLAPNTESGATGCPHTLSIEKCPFCDETLIEKEGQCGEHGVPEALCYQCRPQLIPAFKASYDWCREHGVPESQCYDCNPQLLRGGSSEFTEPPPGIMDLLARGDLPRLLHPPKLGCRTHTLKVQFKSSEIAEKVGLEFVKVARRKVSQSLSCNAEIAYDGGRYARLGPRAPAVISEIKKDLGEQVEKGEVIALFHSVDIAVAKTEFLKHRENVETARSKLEQAKGTFVRMNQIEIRLAAVDLLKARELQTVAQKNVEREERLLKSKATSEKEVLTAQASALKAEATVKALGKKLLIYGLSSKQLTELTWKNIESLKGRGTTSAQPYLAAQIALRTAQADFEAARKRLQLLGLTDKDIKAVVTKSDSSGLLPLYAPFSGILVERRAVVGEAAKPGDLLFALADTSRMWALLDIEESNIANIRRGLPVVFQVQGLRGQNFSGKITWVSTQVDDKTRVLKARAELDNSKAMLRANMFARANVIIRDEQASLIVPKTAVQWEGCCNVVFVKVSDRAFEPRKIQVLFETGDYAVIDSGLTDEEVIVTTGSFLLKTEILKGNIGAGCCGD